MRDAIGTLWLGLLLALLLAGCPKSIPQPEIDAAEQAMEDIESTKDCAPETYEAARTMMDRARALLKEERYEEAKTALLAAKRLAEQARRECDEKRKAEAEKPAPPPAPEPVPEEIEVGRDQGPTGLVTVHFGFNEHTLNDDSRESLASNATYLSNHERVRVQIEGHCDSRGSTEYNLALGERRALSVKRYLIKLGIHPERLEIISYGEERPVNPAENEQAWAANRRAEFIEMK